MNAAEIPLGQSLFERLIWKTCRAGFWGAEALVRTRAPSVSASLSISLCLSPHLSLPLCLSFLLIWSHRYGVIWSWAGHRPQPGSQQRRTRRGQRGRGAGTGLTSRNCKAVLLSSWFQGGFQRKATSTASCGRRSHISYLFSFFQSTFCDTGLLYWLEDQLDTGFTRGLWRNMGLACLEIDPFPWLRGPESCHGSTLHG